MHHSPFSTKHLEQESPRGIKQRIKQSQEESSNYKYATKGAETLSQVHHLEQRRFTAQKKRESEKKKKKKKKQGGKTEVGYFRRLTLSLPQPVKFPG